MTQARSKTTLTIEEALDEFLETQRSNLSASTYKRYRTVLFLFRVFLDHASDHPDEEPKAASAISLKSDARMLPALSEEFRSAFLPHRLHSSPNMLRTAASVMRKFERWLQDRMSAAAAEPTGKRPSREVSAAVQMHRVLAQHLTAQVPTHSARQTKDHFTVTRVEPGELWLEPVTTAGEIIGPVTVPRDVTRLCRVGWDIGGVVAKGFGGWRLLEVWSVST